MGFNSRASVNLAIDIETLVKPVTEEELDVARAAYQPPEPYKPHRGLKDPSKIIAHRMEYDESVKTHRAEFEASLPRTLLEKKRFSLGGKRMISVAVGRIESSGVIDVEGWANEDLSVLTKNLAAYFNEYEGFRLVGYNHTEFDLPEIAKSFKLTGVRPRGKISGKWDIVDLYKHPLRGNKLKDAAKAFGLPVMDVNGADVGKLYEEGNFDKIVEYNKHDVVLTGELYLALSTIFVF